jgi:putative hemolysin
METIDIKQIISTKNPALARWIPSFVIRWLEGIICQDEINDILHRCYPLHELEFIRTALQYLNVSYTLHGTENIMDTKRKLYVSNHPLGGFDGIVLLDILGTYNPDIKTAVNDILMNITPLRNLFLPINKYGRQSKNYACILQTAYASDIPILYFPAGLCSRNIKGRITDLEWKHSAVKIAMNYHRDIVPIYFEGRNSNFFYMVANLRKALNIKINIETFLLVKELFKQRNSHFNVFIGQPIPYDVLVKKKPFAAMTSFIRQKVYEMQPHSFT